MATALKKNAKPTAHPPAISIESELRSLDLQLLDLMGRADVGTVADWANLISCTQRAGLTLREIAGFLPCAVSTVSRWHSGKAAPPLFMREPIKQMLIGLVESRIKSRA